MMEGLFAVFVAVSVAISVSVAVGVAVALVADFGSVEDDGEGGELVAFVESKM